MVRTILAALAIAACKSSGPPAPEPAPRDAAAGGPPPARTVDAVDRAFGTASPDPYRWMEGTDNAELTAWLRAQGAYAAHELAHLPGRDALYARIRELTLGVTAVFDVQLAGGRMFHKVLPAGQQLAQLAVREPAGDRVLVDPARLPASGGHVALNAYSVSPDGALVSYVLAAGGGEVGVLHVMDVATGKDLPDQIERVWGEGAGSWLPDGKSFFYTQLAGGGADPMANQVARLHVLGEPATRDVTILGREPGATLALAPEEWPGLWILPGTTTVMSYVGGAHSEQRIAIAPLAALDRSGAGKTPWREICGYADGVQLIVVHGDRLYALTFKDAPNRRIVSMPLVDPVLAHARVELAEDPRRTIEGLYVARDAIYVLRRDQGHAELLRLGYGGGAPSPLALPLAGWAPDLATDPLRDGLVFQLEGWLAPGTYFAFDPATGKVAPAGLASTTTATGPEIAVDEVTATSSDGTQVPLSILRRKDLALDGSHVAMVTGYGAYGASQSPGYSASRLAWLERGGVWAIAHVRGGGELGRAWQDDGSRERKLNGVRDFIACGEYLIAHGYAGKGKLAAEGGSMGGILIGRAITQRPDLFAAAHIASGFLDPVRLLAAENGANQKLELGDPASEAGYRGLLAMDPYRTVADGTAYPAVIFTVGLNDHRVAPWMTGKMAARLQAATTSHRPILIRVDDDAGHGGIGATRDQGAATRADVWAFLLARLGG
ncbi:MAG TPA: prolyl oligopeptidase family serine peptidase [Kofleriaceae bacterium]|nr:prolyl oligopeptidase family serine peptidase [Kofleriaceae bacterium]